MSLMKIFCVLIGVMFSYMWIRWIWKRRYLYLLSYKLPGKFALPLIGNAYRFLCEPHQLFGRLLEVVDVAQSPSRLWMGPDLFVVISDPENVKRVLSSNKITHKGDIYKLLGDMVGDGLIPASGQLWKRHRRIIQPTFNSQNLQGYQDIFCQQSDILVKQLSTQIGKQFDVTKLGHLCTVDVVMETLLDVRVNAQTEQAVSNTILRAIERSYTLVHERLIKVWLYPNFIFYNTPFGREQKRLQTYIQNWLHEAIIKKSNDMKPNGMKKLWKCSIEHMLEKADDSSDRLSEKEIIDEAMILFTASEDTTSSIYAFTMMALGMYPNVQEKVYQETQDIIGDQNSIKMEDLTRLTYTEMVLKESLRLLPIAPFLLRKVTEEFPLSNCILPVGADCCINFYQIHRDPQYWEFPNEFFPEHHLPEVAEQRHPFCFKPFSAGPRGCIGQQYAMNLMKTMIAKSIMEFRIEAEGKISDLQLFCDISVRVKNGCQLRLFKRNK